ncbi:cysteine peptidase family C39 domain-containing protein [Enterococcus faecalis]|uniref:cysteine peptidase family C39 domain-containing protein n=1 Tax=Enterococcus faecalis TaxID=1351 RepID=UPI003B633FBA
MSFRGFKNYKTNIPLHKLRAISETDLDGTSAFGKKKTFEKFFFTVYLLNQTIISGKVIS